MDNIKMKSFTVLDGILGAMSVMACYMVFVACGIV